LELYAKRCVMCQAPIKGPSPKTELGNYHKEHFVCCSCGTNLVDKPHKINTELQKVFCTKCFGKDEIVVLPEAFKCGKCNKMIQGKFLLVGGKYMHPAHFRCTDCGKEFVGGDSYEFEGELYCKPHYEANILKKCGYCGKPVKGLGITALGKVWHNDHFLCSVCERPFGGDEFYAKDGLAYCAVDYIKLYGNVCESCQKPIQKNGQEFNGKFYHPECFRCPQCNDLLKPKQYVQWEQKSICRKCYGSLPEDLRKRVEKRLKEEEKAKKRRALIEQKEKEDLEQRLYGAHGKISNEEQAKKAEKRQAKK